MGAANSNLTRCLEDEFHRQRKQGRDYLVVDELLVLRLPASSWSLDPSHLGVLFMLDSDRDGRFTLDKLLAFADLARSRARVYAPYEFQAQMQGFCTLAMWRWALDAGPAAFANWVSRLLVENSPVRDFAHYPGQPYLNRDTVETLYHIFKVQETQGLGFQAFLDALQRAGEEGGALPAEREELDDWLPLATVQGFAAAVAAGMLKVMDATFPDDGLAGAA